MPWRFSYTNRWITSMGVNKYTYARYFFFFSLNCFWWTRGPFFVFFLLCRQWSTIPDGSPSKDWQSTVGWGDCRIRTRDCRSTVWCRYQWATTAPRRYCTETDIFLKTTRAGSGSGFGDEISGSGSGKKGLDPTGSGSATLIGTVLILYAEPLQHLSGILAHCYKFIPDIVHCGALTTGMELWREVS